VITQTPTEEHAQLILEPQETADVTSASREMEDEHPDTDIVKEKDELNTKSEDSVSSA
jgi:hypothetical protein